MLGSQALEVAIGIVFVYLLVSLICSAVREGIEAWLKSRAAYLEHGIRELLHDAAGGGLAGVFYNHPLIYSLYSGGYTAGTTPKPAMMAKGGKLPTYIPSKNFALALMDIAARGPATDAGSSDSTAPLISLDSIRANIANLQSPGVQRVLLTAIDTAQGDINKVQASLEDWYNSGMDRVSGWYKRSTHGILFIIGLLVAVGLNVNTITIAEYLYRNDAARAAVVTRAQAAAADSKILNANEQEARKQLDDLNLPIGWHDMKKINPRAKASWDLILVLVAGWLMTAFAATLGAPFWFDVLNKVMVIRSTVKPHEKSPEEASQDHQSPAAKTPAKESDGGGGGAAPVVPAVPPPPPAPPAQPEISARGRDAESDVDGCDVPANQQATADEELPAAEGGVS
jgi:hypothetical protein